VKAVHGAGLEALQFLNSDRTTSPGRGAGKAPLGQKNPQAIGIRTVSNDWESTKKNYEFCLDTFAGQ